MTAFGKSRIVVTHTDFEDLNVRGYQVWLLEDTVLTDFHTSDEREEYRHKIYTRYYMVSEYGELETKADADKFVKDLIKDIDFAERQENYVEDSHYMPL